MASASAGDHACVAAGTLGFRVVDIADPEAPAIVGSLNLPPSEALEVAIAGTHTYVADRLTGLHVIDISNPQSPQVLGSLYTPETREGVAVSSTYACLARGSAGLYILPLPCAAPSAVPPAEPPGVSPLLLPTAPNPS